MNARKRSMLTMSVAALLVLGAASGGVAYTKVTVDGADRTAPTEVWGGPEEESWDNEVSKEREGRQDHPLSKELLPVPGRYTLGPDIGEYGNDAYLSSEKALSLLKKGAAGLPPEARERRREFVDELDVQGMAMRSYEPEFQSDLVVEIRLTRMNNEDAVKDLSSFQSALADAFSIFRKGPEVDRHKNAKCFLLPQPDEEGAGVEEMFCTAYQGDTLVSLTATGIAPLAEKDAAGLLAAQLDRLAEGGGISV